MAKLTLAQQVADLPEAPFDVWAIVFDDGGPVVVRGKCVAKEKSRCCVEWPSGETEKLKPGQVNLNKQDAYSSAAEDLLGWGVAAFMGVDKKRQMRHHMLMVELIQLAAAQRLQVRRASRVRKDTDKSLYGIEPTEK